MVVLQSILRHLRDHGPCIVLINANLMGGAGGGGGGHLQPSGFAHNLFFGGCCSSSSAAAADVDADADADGAKGREVVDGRSGQKEEEEEEDDRKKGWGSSSTYQGHFVVAVGFAREERRIFYHNPSSRSGPADASFEQFDRARTSHGTDQDIIYVFS